MKDKLILSRQWIQFGALSGILANLLFPILILVPLPSYLEIFLAASFGILFSLLGFAIHHTMKYKRPSILTNISAIFIFASGFLFNMMLTIQLTFKGYLYHYQDQVTSPNDLALLEWIAKTVNPIHFGLQVSNDFFLGFAMILLSIAMYRHPYFGKVWSISGGLIASLLLTVRSYAFPMMPHEIGFPYIVGPLVALWFLFVCIKCLRIRKYLDTL